MAKASTRLLSTKFLTDIFHPQKNSEKSEQVWAFLTKEIVEKHKGIITVKSKLNGGTSFTIEIPKEEVNKVL
jgi:sensor histidine kinase regulating citrate/malate metabolism